MYRGQKDKFVSKNVPNYALVLLPDGKRIRSFDFSGTASVTVFVPLDPTTLKLTKYFKFNIGYSFRITQFA